jgi:hypothetical protein
MAPRRPRATIHATDRGTFAVAVDGVVLRDDFKTRALAAMWATRQKIYEGTSPRRTKPIIPPELEDQSIKPTRLLAAMQGESHWRFMIDARAGLYGELYPLGRGHGLKFGKWKAGRDARAIKVAAE